MPAYLLIWSPNKYPMDWTKQAKKLNTGREARGNWGTGGTKRIRTGDRLFFIRLGSEPRGIFAAGYAVSDNFQAPHWDPEREARGDMSNYVRYSLDAIIDPTVEAPLDPRKIGRLRDGNWSPQASGTTIRENLVRILEVEWERRLKREPGAAILGRPRPVALAKGRSSELKLDDPEADSLGVPEGERRKAFVTHRRREARLREAKIERVLEQRKRLTCEVPGCGFDFLERYGELGKDFAHIHHLKPLASRGSAEMTKLSELAVVCCNCHAMIHRGGKNRSLKDLIPKSRRVAVG